MWWRWVIFIVCGILILSCIISTTIEWARGQTGPFGPNPENWWGCGVFTIVVAFVMFWTARHIFKF